MQVRKNVFQIKDRAQSFFIVHLLKKCKQLLILQQLIPICGTKPLCGDLVENSYAWFHPRNPKSKP